MDNKICHVIGAGDFFCDNLHINENDFVIAVDGGYDYLQNIGVNPDLVIGDFDSAIKKPIHPNIIALQAEKDDTDMLAALKEGIKLGFKTFHINGATGGRFDHTMANIQCLAFLAEQKVKGLLFGKDYVVTAISNDTIAFDKNHKGYISVFSHSDISSGVFINGLKYTLENAQLKNDFPIGVSNEFIGINSNISVKNGVLIITYTISKEDF